MIPTVYNEDFLTDYATVDCESPDRAWMIQSRVKDVAEFIEPEACSEEDLLLCHSEALIEKVQRDGTLYEIAKKAVGGAIKAARIGLDRPSFALIRPPGHHAGRDFNGGFCFFNNMAIAIERLLSDVLIKSALIVDIDLHYGNGTQDIVKGDDRISFRNIDSHRREDFFQEFEEALKDASAFDIVGCSTGFDTYVKDWGGILFTDDYRKIGYLLAASNAHVFSVLEGGYFIPDLGANARAFLEGMQDSCL
jgi:acetoin utilization deacetylase AcuC-like enzyme